MLTALIAILFLGDAGRAIDLAPPDPLPRARPVAAGAAHSLAIDPSGAVWSWGHNLAGQLGTGDHLSRLIPTRVSGLTGTFVAVSAGVGHSLALRNDGNVFAWGLNLEGQLGLGNNVSKVTPVQITTLSDVVTIAAGGGHSLAVKADGSLWAWGGNLLGQVGDGTSSQRRSPVRITTLSNVIAVEAGTTHSLALRNDGTAWSWGGNTAGQLGIGTLTLHRRPVRVLNVSDATAIAAGAFHSLALTQTSAVWSWGLNISGALGDGTTTTRKTPVALSGLPTITSIAAGGAHSIAITTTGTAVAWGDNTTGQIGDGTTIRRLSPVVVSQPPSTITAIAAGGAHTIALASDSAVWTWGNNLLAQLGDGTHQARPAPSPISGPNTTWGVHPPLLSPAGGTFSEPVSVSMATPTPDAVIHYTLDGTDPTESHPVFTAPIQIAATTTIKARAFRSGLTPSVVSAATFTLGGGTLATPAATPAAGTYAQPQNVTLTADTGADIRYTLDGSEPTEASALFNSAVTVASTTTLRARAFKAGFTPSEVLTATYDLQPTVPPGEDPPPDPVSIAPPVSDVLLTSFAEANAFLFAGADPIQRGHTPGSITPERMAIVRGQVLDRDGSPLQGVRVRPRDQAGVGYTVTRADGIYDVAVNGGASVLLEFTRAGYLSAQRLVETEWADFSSAPTVRLVTLDPVVTVVSMGPQTVSATARGSVMEDDDGARQATLVVPDGGVMATIHLQDGTVIPAVSQLSIRATEYTVGPGGPEAMPGPLPTTSGYTYAVELSADEAFNANAVNVTFEPPLVFYLENFLDFPVGGIVPSGYYDQTKAAWIASNNGRVVRILGTNAEGQANLDISGGDVAATPEELAELGVTAGERRRLATLYQAGQTLWRSPIPHFSPWDHNWPFGPPPLATRPGFEREEEGSPSNVGVQATARGEASDACQVPGSIIDCQNRVLGEAVAIAGTPYSVTYRSNRSASPAFRTVKFPVTGSTLSPDLKRVEVNVDVAGQRQRFTFSPTPGQSSAFTWNGLDAYQRAASGAQKVTVSISNIYDAVYYSAADFERSFGAAGSGETLRDRGRGEIAFVDKLPFMVDSLQRGQTALAGWDLDVYHRFDPRSQTLFLGNGEQRSTASIGDVMGVLSGAGATPIGDEPVPASQASIGAVRGLAAAPDDRLYVAESSGILRLDRDGTVRRVVSRNPTDPPQAIATAPDGSVYLLSGCTVSRLNDSGSPTVVSGDEAGVCGTALAVATDGAIFVLGNQLYRLARGETEWRPVAAGGGNALAADREGGVYFGTFSEIYRWSPSGAVSLVAGAGNSSADGALAIDTRIYNLTSLAVTRDGHLFVGDFVPDSDIGRVRVIGADGRITRHGGGGSSSNPPQNGQLAGTASVAVTALTVSVKGDVLVGTFDRILRLDPAFGTAAQIPSEDGSVVYEFDLQGTHLRTIDALTRVTLLTFERDAAGRLAGVVDRDGLRTEIVRDGAGVPTAIVSPFGVTTTLTVSNGLLSNIDGPENSSVALDYDGAGLLTSFTDANGHTSVFTYDDDGYLVTDRNAAGGQQTLSRLDQAGGWTATRETLDGGTTSYLTEQIPGGQRRVIVGSDGTETTSVNNGSGVTTTTQPDGTVTTVTLAPDPRFGFGAPFAASTEIRTPSGRTLTATHTRTVAFAVLGDPMSATQVTDVSRVSNRLWRSVFDFAARTITNTSPQGRTAVTTLDDKGRPAQTQAGSLLPTTFTYDAQGRLATQAQGSRTTTFTYDESGYVSSVTDPLDRTVSFTNDALGRRTEQVFPDARIASFGYDNAGNLTSLTPPGRPSHTMAYTEINQLARYTAPALSPEETATSYIYNLAGAPTAVTRADAQAISWTYDTAGRPQTLTTPTGVTTYTYQPTTGKLASLTSPAGGLAYSYDGPLQTGETFSGFVAGAVTWNYNIFFEVSNESINGANTITFGYDNDGLLTSAGNLTYTRDAANGLLTAATVGGTTTTAFGYNDFGELVDETTTRSSTTLYRGVYTRDAGGRMETRTETIGGVATTDQYGYDLAGRLESVMRNDTPLASYGYDANGNRTSVTTGAGAITATYDDQDRILAFGDRVYAHAAHGEVRSWTDSTGTTTLTYDVQGNLLGVNLPSGTTVEYIVDARNRRIGRKVNGAVTHRWLYQGQLRPIAELNASGAVVTRFVYGARFVAPEYMIRGGVTYRLITDHVGSVRLVVNIANGAIAQRIDYDAWGQITADTNPGFQPFGFAGGLYDDTSKLVRFGRRDFDSVTGRWLSKDPVQFDGGGANLLAYSDDDPVNLVDPDGLAFIRISPTSQPEWAPDWLWAWLEPDASDLLPMPTPLAIIGPATGPALTACKLALKKVHKLIGKIKKGTQATGRLGSPMRGNTVRGYRGPEPPHPNAPPGSPEGGWHFNWWDYTLGKWNRGAGLGAKGAIKIE